MPRLKLTEWAAVGELIGTFAVFVSLLFVVYSINQNTAAVQGSTENIVFERHANLSTQFMLDPSLAAILVKIRGKNSQLTEIEAVRWEKYQLNLLDIWALAYNRYQHDLLATEQWAAWNRYFVETFRNGVERLSKNRWNELRYGFEVGFWEHVRASLFASNAD